VVEAENPWSFLNDPALMDDTPIGCLRVIPWGRSACVAIMDNEDHELVKKVIHRLRHGEHPLNAIPGKRTFEDLTAKKLYDRRNEDRERQRAGDERDLSVDLQADLRKFVNRYGDEGAEALASVSIRGA
jgi:hypothetical protein